jgi:hypothetical protein
MTMYGCAKELTEFDGVQDREHVISLRANLEWIGPHVIEMEALLHQVQAVGVVVKASSVEIWSQSWH